MVLLEAPGGWGKTTFAEQVIHSVGLAAVRVRLTDDCSTDGVVAALARGFRRSGVPELAETFTGADHDEQLDGLLAGLRARGGSRDERAERPEKGESKGDETPHERTIAEERRPCKERGQG